MNPTTKLLLTAAAGLVSSLSVHAQTSLFFDFGDSTIMSSGNYNNLVHTNANATAGPSSIANTINSLGATTGISISVSGFDTGDNQAGTTAPTGAAAIFGSAATSDSFFGHSVVFNSQGPLTQGVLSFTGLSAGSTYDLTFFASRTGATDNRETKYEVVGLNSGFGLLDAANNTANVVTISGISADALGDLTVNVTAGPDNNNSSGFFYLGAMEMTVNPVPEPSVLALAGVSGLVFAFGRRHLRGKRG